MKVIHFTEGAGDPLWGRALSGVGFVPLLEGEGITHVGCMHLQHCWRPVVLSCLREQELCSMRMNVFNSKAGRVRSSSSLSVLLLRLPTWPFLLLTGFLDSGGRGSSWASIGRRWRRRRGAAPIWGLAEHHCNGTVMCTSASCKARCWCRSVCLKENSSKRVAARC